MRAGQAGGATPSPLIPLPRGEGDRTGSAERTKFLFDGEVDRTVLM